MSSQDRLHLATAITNIVNASKSLLKFRQYLQRNYSSCALFSCKMACFSSDIHLVRDPLDICVSISLKVSILSGKGIWFLTQHHQKGFCEHATALPIMLNLWYFTLS